MKDMLENEIYEGDSVVFVEKRSRRLVKGKAVSVRKGICDVAISVVLPSGEVYQQLVGSRTKDYIVKIQDHG